jgi:hypothetical protein
VSRAGEMSLLLAAGGNISFVTIDPGTGAYSYFENAGGVL